MIARTLLAAALLALNPAGDPTDRVVPVKGKEVSGRVIYESDEVVVLQAGRKEREYERAEVAEVHSIERSLRQVLEQVGRIDLSGPDALGAVRELALFCEAQHLTGEARNLWFRVVTLDPENEEAWTRLGGSQARKTWRVKLDGKYHTLEDLVAPAKNWKLARKFASAHYTLETDRPLERALDLLLDLERAHQMFYEFFVPHLRLYVFDEVPEVLVYNDADDYPTPSMAGSSWFSATANTLHVLDVSTGDLSELVEDQAYLLLYNSLRRSLGDSGSIAPWARYGLGRFFGVAALHAPGAGRWALTEPYLPDFVSRAGDPDPLTLKQLLRSDSSTFTGNSNALRYSIAAYTLVHFLANAHQERERTAFIEFLRSSYSGKGSTTHFEKILGRDLEEIEAEWVGYTRELAGR